MAGATHRIRVVEATGLPNRQSFLGGGAVSVHIKFNGKYLTSSEAVCPLPSARWDLSITTTCANNEGQLLFEVKRAGFMRCGYVTIGGCSVPVSDLISFEPRSIPLWDPRQQVVGQLLAHVERLGETPVESAPDCAGSGGGLANRVMAMRPSPVPSPRPVEPPCAGVLPGIAPVAPVDGLLNRAVTQALPGSLPNQCGDLLQGSLINQVDNTTNPGFAAGPGLTNKAVEDAAGTRPNALPLARGFLAEMAGPFCPDDLQHKRTLTKAVDELRHVPRSDLLGEDGKDALTQCEAHVEMMFRAALAKKDDREANSALWLAGRLPDVDDSEHVQRTLQDRLREQWERYRMETALAVATGLVSSDVAVGREWLEEVMEALDLAEFHGNLIECDVSRQVGDLLTVLRPPVAGHVERLTLERHLDQVEDMLSILGAGRLHTLGLGHAHSRVGGLRALDLLQRALRPAPGQISFGVLKQRGLRHALMTAKTAIAGDASGEAADAIRATLLEEALPACLGHSTESALAALDACFALQLLQEDVWTTLQGSYESLAQHRRVELISALPLKCRGWGTSLPDWLLTPELVECQQAIRAAIKGADADVLREALVRVKETGGGREVCASEFEEALCELRGRHMLPESWDVESMLAGSAQARLLAKREITDPRVLRAFDTLLKQSTHPVWTRDRRGVVPRGFTAVRVVQVMNAANWSTYVQRRSEIADECRHVGARFDDVFWRDDLNGIPLTREPANVAAGLTGAPPLVKEANELWMIHGTSHAGAEAISSLDFDMARASPAGLFGAGLYLAESVSKSDEYVEGRVVGGEELFPLLVCRATLGYIYYCDTRRPDKRNLEERCIRQEWHSVLGDRKKTSGTFREFIVYDNLQVFPGYVVYYKRDR